MLKLLLMKMMLLVAGKVKLEWVRKVMVRMMWRIEVYVLGVVPVVAVAG
jgi:hypothetical protein